ncbi:MAG: peptidyl-prolyl cis-trans isomerase [Thermoanaerobaculia bacterium]
MSTDSMRSRLNSRLVCGLLLAGVSLGSAEVNEIVLRVNDRIATTYDYNSERLERFQAIQQAESLTEEKKQELLAVLGETVMKDLFEQLLMLSRADQLKIQISPSEIDEAVERTQQNFGIQNQAEFKAALEASGMTEERLRGRLEKTLLTQRVMGQEVYSRVSVDEEDLRRYYQSHADEFQVPQRLSLREVVVLESSGLNDDDLALLAEEIRQQLSTGRDIEEVVAPYLEEGVSSGVIDLGWVEVGDLNQDLEEAVWGLEAGGVSPAVEARGGLHILVVVEREEARLLEFLEVQDQIRSIEQGRLMQDEMAKYIEELKKNSYVVANPPPEAAGFRASLATSLPSELDAFREVEPGLGDSLPLQIPAATPSEGSDEPPTESTVDPPPEGD